MHWDMKVSEMNEDDLNTLFDAARAAPAPVPQALTERVLADAAAHSPTATGGWRAWLAVLGGAPGVGGLITATCVGFWIGFAPPAGLPDLAGLVWGIDTATLSETDTDTGLFGWDIEEG